MQYSNNRGGPQNQGQQGNYQPQQPQQGYGMGSRAGYYGQQGQGSASGNNVRPTVMPPGQGNQWRGQRPTFGSGNGLRGNNNPMASIGRQNQNRPNPYGDVSKWDANAWQNMVGQVQQKQQNDQNFRRPGSQMRAQQQRGGYGQPGSYNDNRMANRQMMQQQMQQRQMQQQGGRGGRGGYGQQSMAGQFSPQMQQRQMQQQMQQRQMQQQMQQRGGGGGMAGYGNGTNRGMGLPGMGGYNRNRGQGMSQNGVGRMASLAALSGGF
jgi:hypothetical protein